MKKLLGRYGNELGHWVGDGFSSPIPVLLLGTRKGRFGHIAAREADLENHTVPDEIPESSHR
jgi:hypothetical protein